MTVGSMLPFERLVEAADRWAARNRDVEVFAQTGGGRYAPKWMQFAPMLDPEAYRHRCADADVIVSHVGMGTIITAEELGKPLVVVPRRRDLAEVTSDHQRATIRWLNGRPGLTLIDDVDELDAGIRAAIGLGQGMALQAHGEQARLLAAVRAFVLASLAGD